MAIRVAGAMMAIFMMVLFTTANAARQDSGGSTYVPLTSLPFPGSDHSRE